MCERIAPFLLVALLMISAACRRAPGPAASAPALPPTPIPAAPAAPEPVIVPAIPVDDAPPPLREPVRADLEERVRRLEQALAVAEADRLADRPAAGEARRGAGVVSAQAAPSRERGPAAAAVASVPAATATQAPAADTPATPAAAQTVTVPAGTRLDVEMLDEVSSEGSFAGERFRARLAGAVEIDGESALAAGAGVIGTVLAVDRASDVGNLATVSLRFDGFELPGRILAARLTPVLAPRVAIDEQVVATAEGSVMVDREVIGAPTRGYLVARDGRVIAEVVAGPDTVLQAAVIGEAVRIPAGSLLPLRLDTSLRVAR